MFCVVYQLRSQGKKLPAEVARAKPVYGYLTMERRDGWPVRYARLLKDLASPTELLPTLEYAHVGRIRGGILLIGSQSKVFHEHIPQAWWCLPGPLDDLTVPPAEAEAPMKTSRR